MQSAFESETARRAAVAGRDRAADGRFFYSVRTTGVYCRPSCGARPARPENVAFHRTAAEAEAAGFRPCRRCRPDQPSTEQRNAELVRRACRHLDVAETPTPLTRLAAEAGMSPFHFHRVFKSLTGLTPKGYAEARRAERVRAALDEAPSVTAAIYEAGFGSGGRFYARSAEVLGMAARRYRSGGTQETIRFAVGECSLGSILVAATARGVCAILFGEEPQALVEDLQDRFPQAELIGGDAEFEAMVARVVGFVERPGLGLDLPLDIRGTAFQQRVWRALTEIGPGRTASYAEIAERIGRPTSARAVAQACAANTIAVAIPCHRVVRADGGLSGYRWGVQRKQALLHREADQQP